MCRFPTALIVALRRKKPGDPVDREHAAFFSMPLCKFCRLKSLADKSMAALPSLRMPTNRNEEYRFTDISSLVKSNVQVRRLLKINICDDIHWHISCGHL